MEPTSQIFSQGGILSKDWFSDKLRNKERQVKRARQKACALTDRVCSKPHFNKVMAALALPTDLTVLSFYGGKVKE